MRHRLAAILPTYMLVYSASFLTAFLLRFDFQLPEIHLLVFAAGLPMVLMVKFTLCLVTGEWRRTFRYTAVSDLLWLVCSCVIAAGLIYLLLTSVLAGLPLPRSVIVLDAMLTLIAIGLLRVGIRVVSDGTLRAGHGSRALVLGTDPDAIGIARSLQAGPHPLKVVGFVDDCPEVRHALFAGIGVYPLSAGWPKLIRKMRADYVLVPSTVGGEVVRELVGEFAGTRVRVQVMPTIGDLLDPSQGLAVRDVTIADLLRREPARLDRLAIEQYVSGHRVLVTGAAGSIGSELCRQVAALGPESLVLLDHSESALFRIEQELAASPVELAAVVGNVTDLRTMTRVMTEHRPQLVFHAAAYKHVPMMEHNPQEAIANNIGGSRTMVDLADSLGVERFVLISTDKAVDPSSTMGATKLVSEKYLQAVSAHSATAMIIVRFGNVLDSDGSVVPTFRRQIAEGGPLTVTHPEMERFFMTIPEAVELVLQAGAIGSSGDVLILEMGHPVKIVDLARDMIELSGLKYPDDIDIVFTGIRPGEKLTETLFYHGEQGALMGRKIHEQIYCAPGSLPTLERVQADLLRLEQALDGTRDEAVEALREVVAGLVAEADAPNGSLRSAA